eukprot:3025086-Amphidinium_carterae.1
MENTPPDHKFWPLYRHGHKVGTLSVLMLRSVPCHACWAPNASAVMTRPKNGYEQSHQIEYLEVQSKD